MKFCPCEDSLGPTGLLAQGRPASGQEFLRRHFPPLIENNTQGWWSVPAIPYTEWLSEIQSASKVQRVWGRRGCSPFCSRFFFRGLSRKVQSCNIYNMLTFSSAGNLGFLILIDSSVPCFSERHNTSFSVLHDLPWCENYVIWPSVGKELCFFLLPFADTTQKYI